MSPYLNFLCSRAFMISLGYMVLVIIDLALLTLGIYLGERATAVSTAGVGIVSFFGVIALVNGAAGTGALDNGEMRKAITAAFITVYLTFVGLTFVHPYPFSMQDDFSKLVGAIVLFYFGSSSFRDYLAAKAGRPADPTINTAPAGIDSSLAVDPAAPSVDLQNNIQIITPPAPGSNDTTTTEPKPETNN